jgi:hypothetical protein
MAAMILIARIEREGPQKRTRHIVIEPDLIVRESSGPAPRTRGGGSASNAGHARGVAGKGHGSRYPSA